MALGTDVAVSTLLAGFETSAPMSRKLLERIMPVLADLCIDFVVAAGILAFWRDRSERSLIIARASRRNTSCSSSSASTRISDGLENSMIGNEGSAGWLAVSVRP